MGQLEGVLWDMDGTSTDSAPTWRAAILVAAEELGINWDRSDQEAIHGHGMWAVAARFRSKGVRIEDISIVALIERHATELARSFVPVWLPGVQEILRTCAEAGIRCGLVTMTGRTAADAILEKLDPTLFEVIISGSDVSRPKPDPEPYMKGIEALGVSPRSCLAIEDSFVGVNSAVAAGLTTIVVNAPQSLSLSQDVIRWTTLQGKTVEDLRQVHSSALALKG